MHYNRKVTSDNNNWWFLLNADEQDDFTCLCIHPTNVLFHPPAVRPNNQTIIIITHGWHVCSGCLTPSLSGLKWRSVLPDGPRICVPVEQSQETVSHHWHNGQTLHSESQTHSDPKYSSTHPEIHKRAWISAETTFTQKYCGGTMVQFCFKAVFSDCDPQTSGGSVKESKWPTSSLAD